MTDLLQSLGALILRQGDELLDELALFLQSHWTQWLDLVLISLIQS